MTQKHQLRVYKEDNIWSKKDNGDDGHDISMN